MNPKLGSVINRNITTEVMIGSTQVIIAMLRKKWIPGTFWISKCATARPSTTWSTTAAIVSCKE
jgi:hypothetical protein